VLENGEIFRGKKFISNVHPAVTIDIFGEQHFLQVYRNRIRGLKNSMSTFIVNLTFRENTVEYMNYNIYQHHIEDVWGGIDYDQETWPQTYFICTPFIAKNEKYAESMSIMTYMDIEEMEPWAHSSRTVAEPGEREESYLLFKKQKEAQVLERIKTVFPGIMENVRTIHSTTPLTFRDYVGNKDGSLYGVLQNAASPARAQINTKTRIPNLYLTGQNIAMHGILGVTASAFVTCFSFVDKDKLIQKVKNA
jgi:all-trans-retinol 13,14-reductase